MHRQAKADPEKMPLLRSLILRSATYYKHGARHGAYVDACPGQAGTYSKNETLTVRVFLCLHRCRCFNGLMHDLFDSDSPNIYQVQTAGTGPAGSLPFT